jgi:2-oxoisovalerate dehydrogenase E1 component
VRFLLVVDETRLSGGVSEAMITALADAGYGCRTVRVTAVDSFVPLGTAAAHVLVSESGIEKAASDPLAQAPWPEKAIRSYSGERRM